MSPMFLLMTTKYDVMEFSRMIANNRNKISNSRNHNKPNDHIHRQRSKYRGRALVNTRVLYDVARIDSGYDESREPNFEQGFIPLENNYVRR